MSNGLSGASGPEGVGERRAWQPAGSKRRALELVTMRGKDVLGVRHLLEEGRAQIGDAPGSIARVRPMDLDADAPVIAEVTRDRFVLHVPRRARARMHGADGLGRLWMGPADVELHEGDRAVLVLGSVQVRAQIVSIEILSRLGGSATLRWIALVGVLYVAALGVCAALAPRDRARLEPGTLRRAVEAAAATATSAAGTGVGAP